jgi:hypothetical protein
MAYGRVPFARGVVKTAAYGGGREGKDGRDDDDDSARAPHPETLIAGRSTGK